MKGCSEQSQRGRECCCTFLREPWCRRWWGPDLDEWPNPWLESLIEDDLRMARRRWGGERGGCCRKSWAAVKWEGTLPLVITQKRLMQVVTEFKGLHATNGFSECSVGVLHPGKVKKSSYGYFTPVKNMTVRRLMWGTVIKFHAD